MHESDINPAALSRISSTPILPPKSLLSTTSSAQKISKSSHIPPRIDLEPIYIALKVALGDNWGVYKEAVNMFFLGNLSQVELMRRVDWCLDSTSGETLHLHNQMIAGIYCNVTREMPDQGVASWVSANDKPTVGIGSKPVSGDAAEQRLKFEIMQLPSRDRRRLKDIALNEVDTRSSLASVLGEHRRPKPLNGSSDIVLAGASSFNKTNLDLEVRKKYDKPLAAESGEFPDPPMIEARMQGANIENGLISGAAPDVAQFMSVATETFIKQVLSSVFDKTRSNGPGTGGSAGSGGGASWIMTHKYRVQLEREEEQCLRGETQRDKSGLLPIEAKAASERGPLGMADLRTALEVGDCGLASMPHVIQRIMSGYKEGEHEYRDDYTRLGPYGEVTTSQAIENDVIMGGVDGAHGNSINGIHGSFGLNGINGINEVNGQHDDENNDTDGYGWEGSSYLDRQNLNSILDSCLGVGS